MASTDSKWTIHDRVVAVLEGRKPDRLPFIERLEIWHRSHIRQGTLPKEFNGMSLTEIHAAVGIGQLKFVTPYALRLRGVEVVSRFDGQVVYHEVDPVTKSTRALGAPGLVAQDKAGVTAVEFITPVGKLSLQFELLDQMVADGVAPYPRDHLIKHKADYRTVEYILERAEVVPRFDEVLEEQTRLGGYGLAVPGLDRIPFQQILLEYLGETALFYALYDSPRHVGRLMTLLDQLITEAVRQMADLPVPYVEFMDNLDGIMTNPRLFEQYCLPYYQRYVEMLHGQGKKVGSHTDGNLKPLLNLLAESGLDVCESFSPFPLTECTFEEAWNAWRNGPIIWGGIPSPILEQRTSEDVFREYVKRLLETVGDGPIILGVGDMVMGHNSIERVRYIAERVENHVTEG